MESERAGEVAGARLPDCAGLGNPGGVGRRRYASQCRRIPDADGEHEREHGGNGRSVHRAMMERDHSGGAIAAGFVKIP